MLKKNEFLIYIHQQYIPIILLHFTTYSFAKEDNACLTQMQVDIHNFPVQCQKMTDRPVQDYGNFSQLCKSTVIGRDFMLYFSCDMV